MRYLLFLLALVVSAQTIRTTRPRVLVTSEEWAAGAAKKTGTPAQQAQYQALVDAANNSCGPAVAATKDSQKCSATLAALYQMDPTTWSDAVPRACSYLNYVVDRSKGTLDGYLDTDDEIKSGNQIRWYGPMVAQAWDSIGASCDTTTRDNMRQLANRIWFIYKSTSTYSQGRWFLLKDPFRTTNNLAIGELLGATQVFIATYDPADFTDAQTVWLPEIIALMRERLAPALTNSTANYHYESAYGGSWPEGQSEYAPETLSLMLDLIDAWRIGTTDIDFWAEITSSFPQYMADWHFRGTSPTGVAGTYHTLYQPYLYRDVNAGSGGYYGFLYIKVRDAMLRMKRYFTRSGNTTYANYTQFFIKTIVPVSYLWKGPPADNAERELDRVLFEDPDSNGVDYRGPLGVDWLTPFMTLSRSDWTANATWVGVQAMKEAGDHEHGDSGQIQIYRKNKWLTRERPGYLSGLQRSVVSTSAHNTLTLNGHGTGGGASRGGGRLDYEWPRMTRTTAGYKSVCRAGYCASEVNLGPVYRFFGSQITPDVTAAKRNFLYLKPDIVIAADRVQYVPGLSARTIAHWQSEKGAASISGTRATIANATQRLHVNAFSSSGITYKTPLQLFCRIIDVDKISNDAADVFLDCGHYLLGSSTTTITGLTGEWAALNGSWPTTVPSGARFTSPYSNGVAYNGERIRLTSTGFLSSVTSAFPVDQVTLGVTNLAKVQSWNDPDVNPTSPGTLVQQNPYRLDVVLNTKDNAQSLITVLEAADDSATPITVSDMSLTADAVTFTVGAQRYLVVNPRTIPPTLPFTYYTGSGNARHLVMGLEPSTVYTTTIADGIATIQADNSTYQNTTDAAGVLDFGAASTTTDPVIATTTLPNGVVGTAYSQLLSATAGTPPYTWSLPSGSLPAGIALSSAGLLSGTPTTAATSAFTVQVTDAAAATDTQALTILVTAPGGEVNGNVTVTAIRRGSAAIVTVSGVRDAAHNCTVDAIQGTTTVASGASNSVLSTRRVAISGLDPLVSLVFRATCGAVIPNGQVDSGLVTSAAVTAVAPTPLVSRTIRASGTYTVEWGSTFQNSSSGAMTDLTPGVITQYHICRSGSCGGTQYIIP